MKQRTPRLGSTAYYIEKVLRYEAEHKRGEAAEDGYAPIMLELLLQLLIGSRIRLGLFSGLVGFVLSLAVTLVIFGS